MQFQDYILSTFIHISFLSSHFLPFHFLFLLLPLLLNSCSSKFLTFLLFFILPTQFPVPHTSHYFLFALYFLLLLLLHTSIFSLPVFHTSHSSSLPASLVHLLTSCFLNFLFLTLYSLHFLLLNHPAPKFPVSYTSCFYCLFLKISATYTSSFHFLLLILSAPQTSCFLYFLLLKLPAP